MKKTFGIVLICFALFMLLGLFSSKNLSSLPSTLGKILILIVLPGAGGGYLLYSQHKQKAGLQRSKEELGQRTIEAEVLKFAREHGGRLTKVEVITRFALDAAKAEAVLDSLARQGMADYEVTDSGLVVYSFRELRHLEDKHQARRVEDA